MVKRDYKAEVACLIQAAKRQGYNVRFDWVNQEWRGMNPAAEAWLRKHREYGRCVGRPSTKTIRINKCERSYKKKSQTLRHELIENNRMKHKEHSYPTAHKIAQAKQRSLRAVK
jgi:hypothetical protein